MAPNKLCPASGRRPSPLRRGLLIGCLLAGVGAGAAVGWRGHLGTLEARRAEAAGAAGRAEREQAVLAEMDGLSPDAPLERWLPYTGMAGMPTVNARARETIQARPYLTFYLVGCLRRADAPTRALALDFVRRGGLPALEVESIPAAREALGVEAATMRARVEAQPDLAAVAFDPECLEAVFLAARYPGHKAAFVEPLRAMRAVLDGLPRMEPAPAGRQELDLWLGRHASEHPR